MSIASEPKLCPKCGATIPSEAPQGLCPKCLLLEISTPTEAGQSHKSIPPTRDELAAAFPHLEILELIGQGGMGFVFKARQPKLDRFVALKILPQSLAADPAFAERFSREGRLLARLNHPNIVTVHDFGVASGILPDVEPGFQPGGKSADEGESEKISNAPANTSTDPRGRMPRSTSGRMPDATFFYLLMEYVDGVNLRQAMKAGRFTAEQALAIVPKICEALQFAHNEGILHRDIKPENILLDTKGRVKIADFGIAKLVNEATSFGVPPSGGPDRVNAELQTFGLTDAGKTLGTPNYMAPEQIKTPGAVDYRADIYSLGVVFYEILTGELPGKQLQPPSSKVQIDVRLDEIVLRALEKKPELRYQQASVLKTQVENIAGLPQASVPPVQERGRSEEANKGHRGMPRLLWLPISLLSLGIIGKFLLLTQRGPIGILDILFQIFLILGIWFRFRLAYVATIVSGLFMVPAMSKLEPALAALGLTMTMLIVVPVLWKTRWFFPAEMPLRRRRIWLTTVAILGATALVVGLAVPPSVIVKTFPPRIKSNYAPGIISDSPVKQINVARFGPAIEHVVTDAIDFDSGKLIDLPLPHPSGDRDPARYEWFNSKESSAWKRQHGIDAVNGNHALMSANLQLMKLDKKDWNTISADELLRRILAQSATDNFNGAHITFGFKTREGGMGILQIMEDRAAPATASLPGVKIRYKLVQTEKK
ncbi:MAG: protein kinase [Verrucomicrobiota bacterium]